MKFYIVTPCFNSLQWLQNAIRSVADQAGEGVEVHHHVQDGLSTDGTPAWLEEWQRTHADTPGYTFTYESAKDAGMYDAINTAWSKMPADADVTAHLNSDEQYLPDALRGVAGVFASHPQADIVETTHVYVDGEGHYLCHRRPVKPNKWVSMRAIQLATCSTFHRASSFRRHGIRFDTRFRIFGDVILYRDIVNAGVNVCTAPRVISSTFAVTGENLAWRESSIKERALVDSITPHWVLTLFPLLWHYSGFCRRAVDCFHPSPHCISIYHGGDTMRRTETIEQPSCKYSPRVVVGQ